MPSVLGKRARAAESSNDKSPISSRLKRRACLPTPNKENVDPLSDHQDQRLCARIDNKLYCSSASVLVANCPPKSKYALGVRRDPLSPRGHDALGAIQDELIQDENVVQLPTPKTPRHRDASSKKVPTTPRHRIGLIGKPLTPRTPRSPSIASNASTVYNCARQLFARSGSPGILIGRDEERNELRSFIEKSIDTKSGRCMYVSGPPGTGKSALVNEIGYDVRQVEGVKTAYINCMSAKSSKDIYSKLAEELLGSNCKLEHDAMAHLRKIFLPKKKSADCVYVVVLDEIDHLLTIDLEILYTLFELSLQHTSRLTIIGIANALDLTDRFLPRLKARNLKPTLLPFLPYTAQQIATVLTTKLKSLSSIGDTNPNDHIPFLHPAAIQLCSKKVASQSGDLRKAFDIVRRTIDLIEVETKQNLQTLSSAQSSPSKAPLGENPNLSSPTRPVVSSVTRLANLTPLTAPRATIAHVARVSAAALSNGTSQRLQTLNLQQKAALCALISHEKITRKAVRSIFATPTKVLIAPNLRQLYVTYCSLCKRENALHPLTSTEFADVISGLETLGLLGEEKGGRGFASMTGTPRKKIKAVGDEKRILSFVDEEEVKGSLDGAGGGILRTLLSPDG